MLVARSLVHLSARNVERVARIQREAVGRLAGIIGAGLETFPAIDQVNRRFVEPPRLAAFDLQDNDIVVVEMDRKALSGRRREVDVGLKLRAERSLQRPR